MYSFRLIGSRFNGCNQCVLLSKLIEVRNTQHTPSTLDVRCSTFNLVAVPMMRSFIWCKTMAYDEKLDLRIKNLVSRWEGTNDKKMFGGVCHLINGNMFCGVHKDFLVLRLGREKSEAALKLPYVRPFDISGKPMQGWVMVASDGCKKDQDLKDWLDQAKGFAKTLPKK